MSNVVSSYKTLSQEEAELRKKLAAIQKKKLEQAQQLRTEQISILGEAVLKKLESGALEIMFFESLELSKKHQKFFEELLESRTPKAIVQDKIE
ncbi:MAG: hypothetical protein ACRCYY_16650 [Trueperaceae bacterium]